ncbi:MAG: trypsin-like peptidase domain-containing protein [Planctomycetes bacterium]|nr:trypsin-like peptidase domain-containing protein [Planctomycetota bacterium]
MRATRLWVPLVVMGTLFLFLLWCGWYFLGPPLTARIWYARETARMRAIRENLPHLKEADGLSTLFREVSKAVKPAVVEVRVLQETEYENPGRPPRLEGGAIGSGVILDRANGYVVTNEHVISGADKITVVLADGRKRVAQWVRSDRMTDLAVIKISPDKLLDIPLGDSDKVEVGDLVLAVGSPIRLPQTVTFGMISAKGRMYGRSDKYQNYLQTDAAINHGNSGGPLINMSGEIVGINVAIVSPSGTSAGLGLAIPSNSVKNVTEQLIEAGKVTRGFIGLAFRAVDQETAAKLKLPHTRGALVIMVAPDGPADKGGIKDGDFILSVDSQTVANSQEFRHIVADISPGTTIPIELYRDGETMVMSVKIILQPENMSGAFRP